MVNLSAQGCLVGSYENARERTYLTLHVSLPEQASPILVDHAVVRWLMERAFGVEFLCMQPQEGHVSAALSAPSKHGRVTHGFLHS